MAVYRLRSSAGWLPRTGISSGYARFGYGTNFTFRALLSQQQQESGPGEKPLCTNDFYLSFRCSVGILISFHFFVHFISKLCILMYFHAVLVSCSLSHSTVGTHYALFVNDRYCNLVSKGTYSINVTYKFLQTSRDPSFIGNIFSNIFMALYSCCTNSCHGC